MAIEYRGISKLTVSPDDKRSPTDRPDTRKDKEMKPQPHSSRNVTREARVLSSTTTQTTQGEYLDKNRYRNNTYVRLGISCINVSD